MNENKQYEKLKVKELKEELKQRKLNTYGNKLELINRLINDDNNEMSNKKSKYRYNYLIIPSFNLNSFNILPTSLNIIYIDFKNASLSHINTHVHV